MPSIAFAATSGFTVGFQTGDSNAPTVPTALTATAVSTSQINLSWTASTDTFGVAGYRIFRDLVFLATSTVTTYSDTGLTASTTYSYTVSAFDAALNISAHSATATATTTDVASTTSQTTTPSTGFTGGSRRQLVPDDYFLPIAVSNLRAISGINRIVLQWDNPLDDHFVSVRIIRSEKGFPQDAYDGVLVFAGRGNLFIDRDVSIDRNYYYGVFAVYSGDVLAAPAVVVGYAVKEPDIVSDVPITDLFEFEDFSFKQDGLELKVVGGLVSVKSNLPIEVYLPGNILPKEARVVVLEILKGGQLIGNWVLVYDRDTNQYRGIIPPLGAGDFEVGGAVYDATFTLIGSGGDAQLKSKGLGMEDVDGGKTIIDQVIDLWWLWLTILLIIGLLYRLLKQHGYEKGT